MSLFKIGVFGCLIANVAPLSAQVSFDLNHTGSGGFLDPSDGPARQAALQAAASALGSYFINSASVTFEVNSYVSEDFTLASGSSPMYYYVGESGFYQTVVQKKIITGEDDNGAGADGNVYWNWYHEWGTGTSIPSGQFDMRNAAMHEILHAMGLASRVSAPGTNAGTTVWNTFDRYLVDEQGTPLISAEGAWMGMDSVLVSGNLYFNGPNAVAANGGDPVRLYSPETWQQGSSGVHVDPSVGVMIMSPAVFPGDGIRTLSAIELGMLQDIGYSVIPEPASALFLLGGMAITLGRRRRRGE